MRLLSPGLLTALACTLLAACRPVADDPAPAPPPPLPEGMVEIPAGRVTWPCRDAQTPPCGADVAAFAIDVHEVTLGAYQGCVDAGVCEPVTRRSTTCEYVHQFQQGLAGGGTLPNGEPVDARLASAPVTCVETEWAETFCAWAGKRLPGGAEWLRAARGDSAQPWPWGDAAPDCARAAVCTSDLPGVLAPWPVGSKADDRSPFGAMDMTGNVTEWTADGWLGGSIQGTNPALVAGPPWPDGRVLYGSHGFRCALSR